jgi:hypothetical protein
VAACSESMWWKHVLRARGGSICIVEALGGSMWFEHVVWLEHVLAACVGGTWCQHVVEALGGSMR